jgi:hypothetical protein
MMQKFIVTIQFIMDEEFMNLVPAHRTYINYLITNNVIDSYAVSMESQQCWIILNAADKKVVEELLSKSPLFKYWTYEIDELFVYDGQNYRLPKMELN